MIAVDSNVFIFGVGASKKDADRAYTELAAAAKRALENALRSKQRMFVPLVVVIEVNNALIKRIGMEEANAYVERIFEDENVEVGEPTHEEITAALEISQQFKAGFSDSLIYAMMRSRNIKKILTFDEDFKKFGDLEIVR